MTQNLPRFDIQYNERVKSMPVLTIKCNFLQWERGAKFGMRSFFGPRAQVRIKRIAQLAKGPDEVLEKYIVEACGVGVPDFREQHLRSQVAGVPHNIVDALATLGRMKTPITEIKA